MAGKGIAAADRLAAAMTRPVPGYFCEAHHNNDYAQQPRTAVDDLTWRCGPHHALITSGGWRTRRRANGTVETIPPAHLDHGQPRVNHYHHPEKLLQDSGDDDESGDRRA